MILNSHPKTNLSIQRNRMRVHPRKEQDSLQESTSLGDSGSGIGGEVGILLLLLPLLGGVGWVAAAAAAGTLHIKA